MQNSNNFALHKDMVDELEHHLQALQHVEIDAALQKFLLRPQREIHVELVITMDNGEVESFNAYRVQHNNFRGPYKGGYRLAPDVDMQEMRRKVTSIPSLQSQSLPAHKWTAVTADIPVWIGVIAKDDTCKLKI